MKHHIDRGSDSDFCDCADWNRASYTPDLLAELGEPLPDVPNDYREAALHFCRIMDCVDEFATESIVARLAVVAVAVALGWPSIRGLSISDIADQLSRSVNSHNHLFENVVLDLLNAYG